MITAARGAAPLKMKFVPGLKGERGDQAASTIAAQAAAASAAASAAAAAGALGGKASLTGAAFTGGVSVSYPNAALTLDGMTGAADFNINASPATQGARVTLQKGGKNRWRLSASPTTEAGGNTGTDFALVRYDDDGVGLGNPFTVSRATGVTAFSFRPTYAGVGFATLDDVVNGNYLGNWNASTNTPALTTTPAVNGSSYTVSVAGTQSITGSPQFFQVGSTIKSTGAAWVYSPPPPITYATNAEALAGTRTDLAMNPANVSAAISNAATEVNVVTFGADKTGVADSAPAFKAARDSFPVGSPVRLTVPFGTYRLDSDVLDNGRHVTVDMLSGAKVGANYGGLGTGNVYLNRTEAKLGEVIKNENVGTGNNPQNTISTYDVVANTGGRAAYGRYFGYINGNTGSSNVNGGDIAEFNIASWPNVSGTGLFGAWHVAVSPTFTAADMAAGKNFNMYVSETNVVNNSPETGFSEFDSRSSVPGIGTPQMAACGHLIKTEIWQPSGSFGGHCTFGLAIFSSDELNTRPIPYKPKFYAGLLFGNDSIAPDGRSIYMGGSTTGIDAELPFAGWAMKYRFKTGWDASLAVFTTGYAAKLPAGAKIGWPGGAEISADSAGKVTLTAPGGMVYPALPMNTYSPAGTFGGTGAVFGAVTGGFRLQGKLLDITVDVPVTTAGTGSPYVQVALPPGLQAARNFTLAGSDVNNVNGKALTGRVYQDGSSIFIFDYNSLYPGLAGTKLNVSGRIEVK